MTDFGVASTPLDSANYTFPSVGNENVNVNLEEFYSGQIRGETSLASFGINASPSNSTQSIDKSSPQVSRTCNKEAVAQAIENGGQSVFVKEALKQQIGGKAPAIARSDSNIDAVLAFQTIRNYAEFKAGAITLFINYFWKSSSSIPGSWYEQPLRRIRQ